MVKQGSIINIPFDPAKGHEQKGYRPAIVVSSDLFNKRFSTTIVCPITSNDRGIPTQIKLDDRTRTQGVVMTDQIKSLDLNARGYELIEYMPADLLSQTTLILKSFFAQSY